MHRRSALAVAAGLLALTSLATACAAQHATHPVAITTSATPTALTSSSATATTHASAMPASSPSPTASNVRTPSALTPSGSGMQPAIPARFLKAWFRHGEGLTIRGNGTAERSERTYTEPDAGTDMYFENDTLRVVVKDDGRTALATITKIRWADGSGRALPPQNTGIHVGDEYAYSLKPDGALNEHSVRPSADSSYPDLAYCTATVSDAACGA